MKNRPYSPVYPVTQVLTEKQVYSEFDYETLEHEKAECPFCKDETRCAYDGIGGRLMTIETQCKHFCGIAAGERGRVTFFYKGFVVAEKA